MVAVYIARFSDGATGNRRMFALTPEQVYLVTAAHLVGTRVVSPTAIELRLGGGDRVARARLEPVR